MRAQVSLDFILALTVALLAVSGTVFIGSEIEQMQKEASIREQLDAIALSLGRGIAVSRILNDGDPNETFVEIEIPKIHVLGKESPQACGITIDNFQGTITLSYDIIDLQTGDIIATVLVEKEYAVAEGMEFADAGQILETGCGETITITIKPVVP